MIELYGIEDSHINMEYTPPGSNYKEIRKLDGNYKVSEVVHEPDTLDIRTLSTQVNGKYRFWLQVNS